MYDPANTVWANAASTGADTRVAARVAARNARVGRLETDLDNFVLLSLSEVNACDALTTDARRLEQTRGVLRSVSAGVADTVNIVVLSANGRCGRRGAMREVRRYPHR